MTAPRCLCAKYGSAYACPIHYGPTTPAAEQPATEAIDDAIQYAIAYMNDPEGLAASREEWRDNLRNALHAYRAIEREAASQSPATEAEADEELIDCKCGHREPGHPRDMTDTPAAEQPATEAGRRPWMVSWERSDPEGWFCRGIRDANGEWVARFDDDYGTDQGANAKMIVESVNEREAARPSVEALDVERLHREFGYLLDMYGQREAFTGHWAYCRALIDRLARLHPTDPAP